MTFVLTIMKMRQHEKLAQSKGGHAERNVAYLPTWSHLTYSSSQSKPNLIPIPNINPLSLLITTITHSITMATSLPVLLCFGFLLLCHGSMAQFEMGESMEMGGRRLGSKSQCRIERLRVQEPRRRIESEAGFVEHFDANDEQFDCAGVSAFRTTIRSRGLLLPSFSNSPMLVYVIQGRGILGQIIPGCPETFQSFQQTSERTRGEHGQQQRFNDQHQKIHHVREGDIIALPAGVTHWSYNNGELQLVTITVVDTSNQANQLDINHRQFLLAGSSRTEQRGGESEKQITGRNILSGFDTQMLADALGVCREIAEKIQGQEEENRGVIVRVRDGLEVLRPSSRGEEEWESEREEYGYGERSMNGLEQAMCSMKIKENIRKPSRADVYNPNAGRLTSINSQKLPILKFLRLSAVWGTLQRNAFLAPKWNINAHGIKYVSRGTCRCQVVDNRGRSVFSGELRQGQILVVPQNFAYLVQSRSDNFEWVTFNTNDNAMVNHIVGRGSALKSMPVDVLMNSYRISRGEARMVKENRGQEFGVFSPRSTQGRASA